MKKLIGLLIVVCFIFLGCGKPADFVYYSTDELKTLADQQANKLDEYAENNNIPIKFNANVTSEPSSSNSAEVQSITYVPTNFSPSDIFFRCTISTYVTKGTGNFTFVDFIYKEFLGDKGGIHPTPQEWLNQGNDLMKCIISLYTENADTVYNEITKNTNVNLLIDEVYYKYSADGRNATLKIEDKAHFDLSERIMEVVQKEDSKKVKKECINTTIDKLLDNGKSDGTIYHIKGTLKKVVHDDATKDALEYKDDVSKDVIRYCGIVNDADGNFIEITFIDYLNNKIFDDKNFDKYSDFYGPISIIGDSTELFIYHME